MTVRRVMRVFSHYAGVDRLMYGDVGQLVKRLVDEDHRHQTSETLLGESRDVADKETQLKRHDHQQCYHHPEPDPETKRYERQAVAPTHTGHTRSQPTDNVGVVFSHFGRFRVPTCISTMKTSQRCPRPPRR